MPLTRYSYFPQEMDTTYELHYGMVCGHLRQFLQLIYTVIRNLKVTDFEKAGADVVGDK